MQEPIWETDGMSKNFTGQDLFNDTQPAVRKEEKLEHPFPAAQPDDHDFVEDDNSDNGEWDAQLAYDGVRSRMRAAEKAVAAAQEDERHERALMDAAAKEFNNASATYNSSVEAKSKAYKEWVEVMDTLKNLGGDAATPDSRISEGIADLDKESEDYVECKLSNLSRMHKLEDVRQEETELEEAEKKAALSAALEKYTREVEEGHAHEMEEEEAESEAAQAKEAKTAKEAKDQTVAEEATSTTEEPTAAELEVAQLKSLLKALEASASERAAGEEARKSAAKKATQDLQAVLQDAQAAVEQEVAQSKSLAEQEAQATAAVEAKKAELVRTQEAIDAATAKYHKLQAEGDVLESQLKDARGELAEYKGYAKFSDKNLAFRFSSSGVLLAVIVAARFLI